jgi:CrcB protein
MNAFLVFLGGGLGALSRWGLSAGLEKLTNRTALNQFPLGVLACNLLGCFLIGCVLGHFAQKTPFWVTPLLVTGFLGGFTTFSTFGRDTVSAIQSGLTLIAVLNILLSVTLGLLAVWAGLRLCSPAIAPTD